MAFFLGEKCVPNGRRWHSHFHAIFENGIWNLGLLRRRFLLTLFLALALLPFHFSFFSIRHQTHLKIMMMGLLTWLSQDATAAKHHGWSHPIATCLIHYAVAATVTFYVHDSMMESFYVGGDKDTTLCHMIRHDVVLLQKTVAAYIAIYCAWLLLWRIYHSSTKHRHTVVYEYTWLCNATLVLGALGLYTDRPTVATAHCVAVGIDQVLWYVDLLGWALSNFNKFPIGVARYIMWPQTSWATRITCTHHLWTIPLLLYTSGGMHLLAYPLGAVIVILNVCLSRFMTPFVIVCTSKTRNTKYLNVNLSHELWKDIKMGFLQINYDNPPTFVYLFRLLWRWQLLNLLVFVLLFHVSRIVFGDAPICY